MTAAITMSATQTATPLTATPAIRAYLGGSFDPVHDGHLQMAMYVYNCLAPSAEQQQRALHVSLLPNARSPFKQDSTDAAHRLAMLQLAIEDTPLQVDELELWQTPPVYTIDSVRTLRQRYPNDSLIFIMGMDSARSLAQWRNGLQLTDYVHLWIFDRNDNAAVLQPKYMTDNSVAAQNLTNKNLTNKNLANKSLANDSRAHKNFAHLYQELPIQLQAQLTQMPADLSVPLVSLSAMLKTSKSLPDCSLLKTSTQGRIYIDSRAVTAISSTDIRKKLREQILKKRCDALQDSELTDNDFNNTYFTDTDANSPIKYLNPAVYQYIIAHQLYSAAQFR